MSFVAVMLCALAFTLAFKDLIRKAPVLFYGAALALSALYAISGVVSYPVDFKLLLFFLTQKGTLATALFIVVMYIGVFRDVDFVRHRLLPVRAQLSIVASILILGHVVKYAFSFATSMGMLSPVLQIGLGAGVVAFWLMVPLAITSVQAIKKAMSAGVWVVLQKWAYLFYGLVYAHLALLLAPSALSGVDGTSAEGFVVYTVLFGGYAALRVAKAVLDRRKTVERQRDKGDSLIDEAPAPSSPNSPFGVFGRIPNSEK